MDFHSGLLDFVDVFHHEMEPGPRVAAASANFEAPEAESREIQGNHACIAGDDNPIAESDKSRSEFIYFSCHSKAE